MLYNLLHYGNEYIKKISMKQEINNNLLTVNDVSIKENIRWREDFDLSKDGKLLNSLNNSRRNYITSKTNVIDKINEETFQLMN